MSENLSPEGSPSQKGTKREQHYVPQLYLRAFASSPRRIHLYNLRRNVVIQNASIQDQCKKARLHGETDDVENALGFIEGEAATILRQIGTTQEAPRREEPDYKKLLIFLSLLGNRTLGVAHK